MAMTPHYVHYLLTQGDLLNRIMAFNADFSARQYRQRAETHPEQIKDSLYTVHPELARFHEENNISYYFENNIDRLCLIRPVELDTLLVYLGACINSRSLAAVELQWEKDQIYEQIGRDVYNFALDYGYLIKNLDFALNLNSLRQDCTYLGLCALKCIAPLFSSNELREYFIELLLSYTKNHGLNPNIITSREHVLSIIYPVNDNIKAPLPEQMNNPAQYHPFEQTNAAIAARDALAEQQKSGSTTINGLSGLIQADDNVGAFKDLPPVPGQTTPAAPAQAAPATPEAAASAPATPAAQSAATAAATPDAAQQATAPAAPAADATAQASPADPNATPAPATDAAQATAAPVDQNAAPAADANKPADANAQAAAAPAATEGTQAAPADQAQAANQAAPEQASAAAPAQPNAADPAAQANGQAAPAPAAAQATAAPAAPAANAQAAAPTSAGASPDKVQLPSSTVPGAVTRPDGKIDYSVVPEGVGVPQEVTYANAALLGTYIDTRKFRAASLKQRQEQKNILSGVQQEPRQVEETQLITLEFGAKQVFDLTAVVLKFQIDEHWHEYLQE